MPEGPLGFPRVTNIGPFTDVKATQEFDRDTFEEKPADLLLDREISSIHDSYDTEGNRVRAELIVRQHIGEYDGDGPLDRLKHEMDILTRDETVAFMTYFYNDDVGRVIDVQVEDEFQRIGIGTRLKSQELDHMQDQGVEVVYTDVISEGGYRLADKTGFEPIYRADHINFQESSLVFNDSSNRGVMFKYL